MNSPAKCRLCAARPSYTYFLKPLPRPKQLLPRRELPTQLEGRTFHSQTELADALGVKRQCINEVLAKRKGVLKKRRLIIEARPTDGLCSTCRAILLEKENRRQDIEPLPGEEWKQIPAYPDYWISRKGRVLSNRKGRHRLLTISQRTNNYPRVVLTNEQGSKPQHVHRLLAEAFIPNPEGLPQVHHLNHNKNDFSLSNLKWVTEQENMLAAIEAGVCKAGRRVGPVKCITNSTIYPSIAAAAEALGLNYRQVWTALRGTTKTTGEGYAFVLLGAQSNEA